MGRTWLDKSYLITLTDRRCVDVYHRRNRQNKRRDTEESGM